MDVTSGDSLVAAVRQDVRKKLNALWTGRSRINEKCFAQNHRFWWGGTASASCLASESHPCH